MGFVQLFDNSLLLGYRDVILRKSICSGLIFGLLLTFLRDFVCRFSTYLIILLPSDVVCDKKLKDGRMG